MPNRHLLILTLPLLVCCLAGPAWAGPFGFSALYVLGDSQSDSGNSALLTPDRAEPPYAPVPDAPYPSGRLTNGPVWAEYLAERLGRSAAPSLAGGTNYAVATAAITGGTTPAISLEAQATQLIANLGSTLPPNALFAVWGGANDTFQALNTNDPTRITTAITALDGILRGLVAAGARHFLVPNLGDAGLAPVFAAAGLGTAMTNLSRQFNSELDLMLTSLMTDLPGIDLVSLDVFALSRALAGDPAAFGLSNITTPCLIIGASPPDPTQCTNPDEYAFWDALHFTTAVHRIFGDAAYAAVPLPPALVLIAPGLLLLLRRPRKT
jgi:phospholipase/lecithinase/hemolysin